MFGKSARSIASLLAMLMFAVPLASLAATDALPESDPEEQAYEEASAMFEAGDYWGSLQAFEALGDYRDSVKRAVSARKLFLKGIRVGSSVFFGAYEQDNDPENGAEGIEWIILVKQDKKLLLLSRYALDCMQYHSEPGAVTWETCSLRAWLNGPFLERAFNEEERERVLEAKIQTKGNSHFKTKGGKTTKDKVFLLSTEEVTKYFGLRKYANRNKAACKGTPYCYAQGAFMARNGNCWWWTRSPGMQQGIAAYVHYDGTVNVLGISAQHERDAVRPAIWISL